MNDISIKNKKLINMWRMTKTKPLLIMGEVRSGKSKLAMEILKDYHTIEITSEYIKSKQDVISIIDDSLSKKDIFMMCSSKNTKKSLLIDDFNLFIKYDKPLSTKLLNYIIKINNPTIITSSDINHKYIQKLKNISIVIELDGNVVNKNISEKDISYTLNDTIELLLNNKISLEYKLRISLSEYLTLSLNIIENSIYITESIDILYNIYKNVCIGDYIESKMIEKNYDTENIIVYYCLLPSYYLSNNKLSKLEKFNYNSYLSKSLIQIHMQTYISSFPTIKFIDLLYNHQFTDNSKEILLLLKNPLYNLETIYKHLKIYNYFYNKGLKKNKVKKLLNLIES